jgi:hypothetical protein
MTNTLPNTPDICSETQIPAASFAAPMRQAATVNHTCSQLYLLLSHTFPTDPWFANRSTVNSPAFPAAALRPSTFPNVQMASGAHQPMDHHVDQSTSDKTVAMTASCSCSNRSDQLALRQWPVVSGQWSNHG